MTDPAHNLSTSIPEVRSKRLFKPVAMPFLLALGLALLAYRLTYNTNHIGLNFPIWISVFIGVCWWGLARQKIVPSRESLVLLGMAWLLGVVMTIWIPTNGLAVLNVLGIMLALGLGASTLRFAGMVNTSVLQMIVTLFTGIAHFFSGGLKLLTIFPWQRLSAPKDWQASRWLVGILLTVPVLLLFGTLLASADQAFAGMLGQLFDWKLDFSFWNIIQLLFWCAFSGGLVYSALVAREPVSVSDAAQGSKLPQLGLIELGMPLVSLAVLFVLFLLMQLPYFLSGLALPDGVTFSQYINKGFGELSIVTFLTLGLVLLANAFVQPKLRTLLAFKLMNLAVLAPLALLIFSAANRWRLYFMAYGLSESRVLGVMVLFWLALCLVWLVYLLFKNQLQRFAYPALILGFGTLIATNILHPASLIAQVNFERAEVGVTNKFRKSAQEIQPWRMVNLGPGAVPYILEHWDLMLRSCVRELQCQQESKRLNIINTLKDRYGQPSDMRTWNASYARAHQLIKALD